MTTTPPLKNPQSNTETLPPPTKPHRHTLQELLELVHNLLRTSPYYKRF